MTSEQKDILGMIFPFQGMYSYAEILQGALSIAPSLGYRVQACYGSLQSFHQYFHQDRIAAWAIINEITANQWVEQLDQSIPQLIISPDRADARRSIVIPDNVGGARLIVDHLISHGHERIAFVGSLQHPDIAGRYRGYQQALQQAGLRVDPALTVNITRKIFWGRDASDEALTELLQKGDVPFTAVFAASDELALGVIIALQRCGLKVPTQIAVVGFDDCPLAPISQPPLTTVRQSYVDLGRTAVQVMVDMAQGSITAKQTYEVMSHVIVRTSCGCVPQYMHDDLLISTFEPTTDRAKHIINIAEALVSGSDMPTSIVYPMTSQLYESFHETLRSYDIAAWSQVLEEVLPRLLSKPEIVNNLPSAIPMLAYSIDQSIEHAMPKAEIAKRTDRLIAIIERAAVFFGVIGNHIQNGRWFDLSNTIQSITRTLAQLDYEQLISLEWMKNNNIYFAALFLPNDDHSAMYLRGLYQETERPITAQLHHTVDHIPPADLLHAVDSPMAMIHALEFKEQFQGVLYLIPYKNSSAIEHTYYGTWVEQLAALLSRFRLEENLRQNNESLRALHEQERALSVMVRDLSAPVVPITEGIVVLPLIGIIDDARAEQIIQNLLESVSTYDAEVIVLDITGVPIVDTQTASYLLRAAQAVRLLGAQIVLTGIRPEIAQTIVHLGIDTKQITTAANMEAGLRYALRIRGLQISSIRSKT